MNTSEQTWLERAREIYLKRQEELINRAGSTWRIVLYRDGSVERDTEERSRVDILFDIPIPQYYFNLKSRLLFCYNNGHANVMIPKRLREVKLKERGAKLRGWKNETGITLMNAFVCKSDDYLIVFSRNAKGLQMVKAVSLHQKAPHQNMDAKGNVFVKDASPYKWMIVPKEFRPILLPIISRDSSPGIELNNYRHAELLRKLDLFASDLSPSPIIKKFPQ